MPATRHERDEQQADRARRPTAAGVTSRCTGLTAMTSMAAISSRILRLPRSAVMAEPPAPAMSRAVATGAASRTMASTMAAPVVDSAPSWRLNVPTCRAMTMPNGIEMRITGMQVTLAMNQHWRRYSCHHFRTSQVRRNPSREMANRLPVSRTRNCTLPIIGATVASDRHDLVAGRRHSRRAAAPPARPGCARCRSARWPARPCRSGPWPGRRGTAG